MSDTMVTPPGIGVDGGGGGSSWVATHKPVVIGMGLVLVLGVFYFIKKKGSASTASGSVPAYASGGATSTGPAVYEIAPGTADSGSMSQGITTLEQQIASMQASMAANAASSYPSNTAPGSGVGGTSVAPVVNASTPTYTQITANAARNDLANGQVLYQQGQEAINFDTTTGTPVGQSIGSVNPNSYYALSPGSARALINSGKPIYAR